MQLISPFRPSDTTCDECFLGIHQFCVRMGCLSDPLRQANHGPARGGLQHTLSSYIELLQSCPAAEGYGDKDLWQYV